MVMVHSIFVIRTQQMSCDIRNFACRGENWQTEDRIQLFCNKTVLCIAVLNNKTIVLLNLAEYPLIQLKLVG